MKATVTTEGTAGAAGTSTVRSGHKGRWGPVLALALPIVGALSCTVFFGGDSARQCDDDADCAAEPALRGRMCDREHGVCVAVGSSRPVVSSCVSTEACTRQNSNKAAICRKPGEACLRLETPDCPQVVGDWQAPDAVLLGSIGPQTQIELDSPEPLRLPYVPRLLDAMNLALAEWQLERASVASVLRRPIAIVHCDSAQDPARAKRVMSHLVNELGAPIVFTLSDVDLAAVANIAAEAGAVLACTGCYARPTIQEGRGPLAWQLHPALDEQAALAAWRVSDLEARLREQGALPQSMPLRVAQLSQSYPGITELAEQTRALLRFNGGLGVSENTASFLELQTPDPRYEPVTQITVSRAIAAFAPHVIVVEVDSDFTTYYLRQIEEEWPADLPRPFYVASSMNQELGLLGSIVGSDESLRVRLSGTALYASPEVAENLDGFASRFRRRYQREHDNTQFGYDAVYVAAYALSISAIEAPGQGVVANAFAALMAGPAMPVGPSAIPGALAYLVEQREINLSGASSLLDWEPTSGGVSSDVGLWCLSRRSDGELLLATNALPRWSHATGQISGSYACP